MKEPYAEGLASRGGPESCAGVREDVGEALTGERIGEVGIEPRNQIFGVPTLLSEREGNTGVSAMASSLRTPRGRRPSACVDTLCAGTGRSHDCSHGDGSAGRIGKAQATIR